MLFFIKFQDNRPFISGEEAKKRLSRLRQWRPIWISHRNNFSFFFYLQVTRMLLTKFHIKWSLFQEKTRKINFQDGGHGGHLGFPNGMRISENRFSRWLFRRRSEKKIFKIAAMAANLDFPSEQFICFLSISHPDANYQVSCQVVFVSGEEAKNKFSRWWPWRPSWMFDRNNFSYFWSSIHPDASYQVLSQPAFRFRRRSKN